MRRFRTVPRDFDTRAIGLDRPISEHLEDAVRAQELENRSKTLDALRGEYGHWDFERKLADFIAIGVKPFSVLAYHNLFFDQTRHAFVHGAHYPALLAACALGERTLNHLVLDLREDFNQTLEHEAVASAKSFSNWKLMIDTLSAWGVFDGEVTELFRRLAGLRHRSIHFNSATYAGVRDDALAAVTTLRDIIDKQFGAFGRQRWFIRGTLGACFIAKAYEKDPFVRRFILPTAQYVGPLHSVRITEERVWQFVDWPPDVYGVGEISDEDYCRAFNECDPSACVPTEGSFVPATILNPEDAERHAATGAPATPVD